MFLSSIRVSVVFFLLFTVLLGAAYPAVTTGIIQILFSSQADGSLIIDKNGAVQGSALIGQNFSDPKYFWGRLSATGPTPYNAAASSGSNLGAANPALQANVKARIEALQKYKFAADATSEKIPVDLVTASGSGLDPQISIAAANYQIRRIAEVRRMPEAKILELVKQNTIDRQFGILGEPRVNILQLNLALDKK